METNHITHPLQAMSMGLLDHVEERGLQKGQRELLRKQLGNLGSMLDIDGESHVECQR